MSLWRQLTRGLRVLTNRKSADRDTADEVSHYLDESTSAFVARGLSPSDARRAAQLELGGTTAALRDEVRAYGWENRVDNLLTDLRYGMRKLAGNPGFTAISVLTLALGIGASTAIFSVVDAVLLRALPYPEPQQIVRIWEQAPNGHRINIGLANFDDFAAQSSSFSSLSLYSSWLATISAGGEPARVNIAEVSSGFLKTLGVDPLRGRAFVPEEQHLHGSPAVIVSYSYWQRYLGSTADLSKAQVRMEEAVYPVVGVMPEGFDFPADVAAWFPRELFPENPSRTGHNWRGLGRVRAGATVAQARADLSAIARRIHNQYGKQADLADATVVPLADAMVGDVRTALLTLLSAVGLLLLVACANVAGLLLARNSARRKELAVRAALGAGRGRMIQQFLCESFSLSLLSGLLGILIAGWAVRVLPAILPANLPRQQGVAVDTRVLLFALAVIVAVAASLGLFAAWRAVSGDLQEALTSGGARGSTGGSGAGQRFRGFLVVGEIATTLVILMGAGLLGRSFLRLVSTNPGFSTQNLITMEFSPPNPEGRKFAMDQAAIARQVHLMDNIASRLRVLPGVDSVGLAGAMPVAAGDDLAGGTFVVLNGQKPPADAEEMGRMFQNRAQIGHADYCVAGESYFHTMGIPLVRGRIFGPQDDWNAPHAAVISQTLVRQRWPNQDPIGQTIEFGNMDGHLQPLAIVGIVADVRAAGLDRPPSPVVYVDYHQRGQNANSTPTILLRASGLPPAEIMASARAVFHDVIPDVPVKFS
ncbi:MAG TPA: ABC transporter permease, partial [Bryobacteraceae bacterium]